MTIKITPEFIAHIRTLADGAEQDAGYGGRMDDGGARHSRELICAYEAGRDGKIPSFWIEELKSFEGKRDEEYQNYLRLKNKFKDVKGS